MDIYFDESIHDRGNFIILAAVVADEYIISETDKALRSCGFIPGIDEFKSSMSMKDNPKAQALRESFKYIIGKCKVAVGVAPINERSKLMELAIRLTEIISKNGQPKEFRLFLDEGIKNQDVASSLNLTINRNCNSKSVLGIQLADCCAHFLSSMLLGELGLFKKTVPVDPETSGFEGHIELAWELWATLRYAMSGDHPVGELDSDGFHEPLMTAFGFICSNGCDNDVITAAHKRFGTVWIGCIH